MNYKSGFTLAEVLITLGIIGVVAALTIPTLINKYQERELVTRARKAYAQVTNAIDMARADRGYGDNTIIFNPKNTSSETLNKLVEYFKVQEVCKPNEDACGGRYEYKPAKPISNDGETYIGQQFYWMPRFMTIDGAVIGISQYNACKRTVTYTKYENGVAVTDEDGNPVTYETTVHSCAIIMIDTTGNKGPNQIGKDVFSLTVLEDSFTSNADAFGGGIQDVVKTGKLMDTVDYNIGDKIPETDK